MDNISCCWLQLIAGTLTICKMEVFYLYGMTRYFFKPSLQSYRLGQHQFWEACFQHQHNLLSPSLLTLTYPCSLTTVCNDTWAHFCHILGRLLPCCLRQGFQNNKQQWMCWVQQPVRSAIPGSLTVAWQGHYMPSFTGSMHRSTSGTNSVW